MGYCPQCGAENPVSHRACTSCGTLLQTGLTPGAFATDAPQRLDSPFVGQAPPAVELLGTSPTPHSGFAPPGTSAMQSAPAERVEDSGEARPRRVTDPTLGEGGVAATIASAQPHSSGGRLIGFLVSYDVTPQGGFHCLYSGTLRVGRKDAAPMLDVAIEHPTVSSNHALFYFDSSRHIAQVEDTGSANGTLLNDAPIAGTGRRELRDGDRIRFGAYKAIVKLVERP